MIYAYIRVSTDRQTSDNQRYEILKTVAGQKLHVDEWLEETVSGTRSAENRALGGLLSKMKSGDTLYVTELSRLGRSLMEIMSLLHRCMEANVQVVAIKEGYELGNNLNSKVLAFAFGLSAEIERQLISQRTKEALSRKKAEGVHIGRPKGRKSTVTKLTGKEDAIKELLKSRVSISAISRILNVNRQTVSDFIESRKINNQSLN